MKTSWREGVVSIKWIVNPSRKSTTRSVEITSGVIGCSAISGVCPFVSEAQGATITQILATDQWRIQSGLDLHTETITLSNHAVLQAGDFFFV